MFKYTLEEFASRNTLNKTILDNMVDIPLLQEGYNSFEEKAIFCFSVAYRICGGMMSESHLPLWKMPDICRSARYHARDMNENIIVQAVSLSIVLVLMEHVDNQWRAENKDFIIKLEDYIKKMYLKGETVNVLGTEIISPIGGVNVCARIPNILRQGIDNTYVLPLDEFVLNKQEHKIEQLEERISEIEKKTIMASDETCMDIIDELNDEVDFGQEDTKSSVPPKNLDVDIQLKLDDAQKTIQEQDATIKDLNDIIKKYQMRGLPPAKRKGIALGLTPIQADIFGDFLTNKLGIVLNNKKEELSLMLNCLFGQGRSSLANKMSKMNSLEASKDRLYVASIFGPFSPETAKEICSDWTEDTPAPWVEEN